MKRLFPLAALAAVVLALPLAAQDKPATKADDKPPEPTALQKKFADLSKEFQAELGKKVKAAKDDEAREAIFEKLHEIGGPFAEKAVKLADENPKDAGAMEALTFAVIVGRSDKAAEMIAGSLQGHKDLPGACVELARDAADNPAVETLLKKLAEKATDKKLKGTATLAVATLLMAQADKATDVKKTDAILTEAETFAVTVTKEYADLDGPEGNLGDAAKKMLFQIRNLSVGRTAPEVVSRDLDDKEVKLSAHKGKVVVLDIWATWCGPCRAMIPHERELVEKLKGKPFVLISVSADEEKEALTKFLEKEKMPWLHWWEGGKKTTLLKDWNVQFFPTIYVIDAKGVIRHKHVRGKKLDEAVEALVKEAEAKP